MHPKRARREFLAQFRKFGIVRIMHRKRNFFRRLRERRRFGGPRRFLGNDAERIGIDGFQREVGIRHTILLRQYARDILFFPFPHLGKLLFRMLRIKR